MTTYTDVLLLLYLEWCLPEYPWPVPNRSPSQPSAHLRLILGPYADSPHFGSSRLRHTSPHALWFIFGPASVVSLWYSLPQLPHSANLRPSFIPPWLFNGSFSPTSLCKGCSSTENALSTSEKAITLLYATPWTLLQLSYTYSTSAITHAHQQQHIAGYPYNNTQLLAAYTPSCSIIHPVYWGEGGKYCGEQYFRPLCVVYLTALCAIDCTFTHMCTTIIHVYPIHASPILSHVVYFIQLLMVMALTPMNPHLTIYEGVNSYFKWFNCSHVDIKDFKWDRAIVFCWRRFLYFGGVHNTGFTVYII